ncbi:MAG TPA: hypothetical protein RMH85_17565 [Polyangiaceae bacterium LLY-WYZ-15_(1-7)]|nr:hypothetical protein [Polyangiaceae bacterium LLY-WYZ-15_(1-7)]HJL10312.1 hypothetical protein [Polyangiaceae bacterium LLY-WYZ-15_(1-7)]HJL22330.1 hypothetical protein [Polyangiaceae bacterium LLY-WYZ-15_(1-7)]HJL36616.1 hypothetical protein [Polyangiaceae bacterium LLY-WYZ-15_(1-7)]
MSTTDRTAVTGAPAPGLASPRRGQVVGERYEVRGRLRDDPFSFGFLAFDQETEDTVLLRVVRPELVDAGARGAVLSALRKAVGIGGKFLPGLLDADRDGAFLFTTEPVPAGVSLRDVLDRRLAQGQKHSAEEALPVVAQLQAALAAIPPPLRHGDVRADLVWVDPNGLQLTGAFLVPALPAGVVAAVLQRHGDLRRRTAPEVLRDSAADAADRFGVAAIAHEMLTLAPPPDPGAGVSPALGPLGEPLAALLHPDPRRRTGSLDALVERLASTAGLAPPELEPAPFRSPRRFSLPRARSVPPTAPPYADSTTEVDPLGAEPPTEEMDAVLPDATGTTEGATEGTVQVPLMASAPTVEERLGTDTEETELAEGQTSKLPALAGADADAILAKAKAEAQKKRAAAEPLPPRKRPPSSDPGLDPRFVRAALAAEEERKRAEDGEGSHHLSVVTGTATDPEAIAPPPVALAAVAPKGKKPSDPGLDPRLVRAALGVSLEDEPEAEEEESAPGVPLDPATPAAPAKEGTQELAFDELEMMGGAEEDLHPPKPEGTMNLSLDDLAEMEAERRRAAVPADVKPVPRPRKDSGVDMRAPVLFDDGAEAPADVVPPTKPHAAVSAAKAAAVAPAPVLAPEALPASGPSVPTEVATDPGAAKAARPRAPRLDAQRRASQRRRRNLGVTIVVVALVLGVGIIVGSFLYAQHKRSRAEELRQQRLQERFERLQREELGAGAER